MKIEIVSGQPNANIHEFFTNLLSKNGICVDDVRGKHFMVFPEYRIVHQQVLFEDIRKVVSEYIARGEDLYILTYSDHVFNAARVEIKRHKLKNCLLHQVLDNGTDACAYIDDDGHLSHWADGVFDTWDNALTELLTS